MSSGKTVLPHCDNESVVTVLNKDLILAAIARHICLSMIEHDICLKTIHIKGKDNIIADNLSRWFTSEIHRQRVLHLLPHAIWDQIPVNATVINWAI